MFDELTNRRLIFVMGKGGVGKSTIASAISKRAAKRGKRVLLVGIDSTRQIETFFNSPIITREISQLKERLFGVYLDRQQVLDQWVKRIIKLKPLYNQIMQSMPYKYVSAVAPGFRELLIFNAIFEYEKDTLRGKKSPRFDLIVVDCPATGHGMSFLEIPRTAIKGFTFGPMNKLARQIDSMLSDHKKTAVLLVSLAEEMPANETVMLYNKMVSRLEFDIGAVVINCVYPRLFSDHKIAEMHDSMDENKLHGTIETVLGDHVPPRVAELLMNSASFQLSRQGLNDKYLNMIKKHISTPSRVIPFIPKLRDDEKFLNLVAKYL